MRATIALTLIALLVLSACSSSPTKHRKRMSKRPQKEQGQIEQPAITKKKQKKKTQSSALPSVDSYQKLLLPTRI
ncbi:MAG TPA: hypothetical protein QF772_04650, partial [Nitrospinaceae bacterium]|nr:hypothetical protein [Nitrospinaceae bacterium]